MGNAAVRIVAVVVLTAAILALPGQQSSLDLSMIPGSVDEIAWGMNNWIDHRSNPDCAHPVLERFYSGFVLYWSHGLD